jgi:Secretion system C-terminal sorting domain
MKKVLLLLSVFFLLICSVSAQRYLTNQFTTVDKTTTIYARNYTVLAVSTVGRTLQQPLLADVYQPTGDTLAKRPLMIYVITGNFLPRSIPGLRDAASGERSDSAAIEIATRMAKLGYVTAVIDYRLGWNPTATGATGQEVRTNTLINAAYRGLQDVRSAIRFFKANASTYKVDTTKIMLWGQGTGGYVALAAASLDKYSEITTTKKPVGKFFGSNQQPMVIEQFPAGNYINSDVEGKNLGKVPPSATPTVPPAGDTLCLPNHVANTSDFQFCVNAGGALGDISWIDSKTVPTVSIQCVHDPFAPYESSVLTVPVNTTTALPVVEVQGGKFVQTFIDDSTNINKIFLGLKDANNPYKALFTARNGGRYLTGLYPMLGDTVTDSSPYEFFVDSLNKKALSTNPRISAAKARKYIDSMMVFVLPRACIALKLPCNSIVNSTEELLKEYEAKLVVSPNPAQSALTFESEVYNPIQSIELFDLSGRSINYVKNINSSNYQLNRGSIPNGMYIAKVKFEGGILSKKIVFDGK